MGERGPKAKTEAELRATGSWRKSQAIEEIETEIPQSGRGSESPPSWLTPEEVKIWEDFLPKALEMKTYSNADHFSFGLFCRAAHDLLEVQKKLKSEGIVYEVISYLRDGEEQKVKKKNQLIDIERIRRDTFNKYADQFGFNPQARTRLKIVPYTKAPAPSIGDEASAPVGDEEFYEMMGITKTT